MSFIDPTKKQINCKIVYFGPVLAGKATTLKGIDTALSQKKAEFKKLGSGSEQTLFFGFLPLSLGEVGGYQVRVHLYSIASPILQDTSRRLILKGLDGIVFVADSQVSRLEENVVCLRELDEGLRDEDIYIEEVPLIFQYNKRDLNGQATPVATLNEALNPDQRPFFESIAKKKQGIMEPLEAVTRQVIQELRFD